MASVRVAVRVRPMNRREKDLSSRCIIRMEGSKTSIINLKITDGCSGEPSRENTKTFTYDFSYNSTDCQSSAFVSQVKVFEDLGSDVLQAAFEGYNACVFAYGQTGSGKSYTMMGAPVRPPAESLSYDKLLSHLNTEAAQASGLCGKFLQK